MTNATIGSVSVTSTGITTAGVVHGGALASDTNIMLGGSIIYQQPYGTNTNTALGVGANGGSDSSGTGNTASGNCAMNAGNPGNPGACGNPGGSSNVPAFRPPLRAPSSNGGGKDAQPHAMQMGNFNTAHGFQALSSLGSGSYNTAHGANTLFATTTGNSNTAIGAFSLANNSSGSSNTAVGIEALANGFGSSNTALGFSAFGGGGNLFLVEGSNNIGVGANAGNNLGTGSGNIYIGSQGGGTNNIIEGRNRKQCDTDRRNTALGDAAIQTAFHAAGIAGATVSGVPVLVNTSTGQLGVASSSRRFKEDIHDMSDASDGLMRLRPVTFRYKQPFDDGAKPIQYGLIAEEVAEVYPDLVARSADSSRSRKGCQPNRRLLRMGN